MTCVVGIVDNGVIYMGADSAGVSGYDLTVRKDPKVFVNGEFIIGYTTSFRMGQILRYSFHPPKPRDGVDAYTYMCTDFVDTLIQVTIDKRYASISDNEVIGGQFLVGYRGELFEVEGDFQVGMSHKPYAAVGCGAPYALGAMFVTGSSLSPTYKVRRALECAEEFSAGVRGPFVVEQL